MTHLNQFQIDAINAQFQEGKSILKVSQDSGITKYKAFQMFDEWILKQKEKFVKANRSGYVTKFDLEQQKNSSVFTLVPRKPTAESFEGALFYTVKSLEGEELKILKGLT